LDFKAGLENLAVFFAQFSPEFDHLIPPSLPVYTKPRQQSADMTMQHLSDALMKKRRYRRLNYVKKCYRSCSEFIRRNDKNRIIIYRRDTDPERIGQLLADPDGLVDAGIRLKDGNSATVTRIKHPEGDWIIKRYNVKNVWHGLKRCLRASRAWISWGNAHRLSISGIATPQAIAVIEKRIGPLRWGAYYVCDYVSGPDAAEYFKEWPQNGHADNPVAWNFVHLFNILHKIGIFHGDCKATNFLIKDQQPWVIDLDAMKEFPSRQQYLRHYQTDRQRFLCNWPEQSYLQYWFEKHLPK
jgi:tRNA A-37 threonylcarbamoyl transferase component Bud32